MKHSYNIGVIKALNDVGVVKIANPQLAAQIAAGASPEELQMIPEAKITEKDIESAAKIVQVLAEMKQRADEAGLMPEGENNQAAPYPGV